MKSFYSSLTALLFFLNGCSILVGQVKPVEEKSVNSQTKNKLLNHPDWKQLEIQSSVKSSTDIPDAAWQSQKTAAVISLNSVCRRNIDRSDDLKNVTRILLSQWDHLKILSERSLQLSGFPAYETVARGKYLDRDRKFKVIVVKSPSCVYDLVFLSPLESFNEELSVFQQFYDNLILK